MKHFQKEIKLLLCCLQKEVTVEDRNRINLLLQKDLDWEYIIHMSLKHRVMPLLYQNLTNTFSNIVPEEALRKLRLYFIQNSARNIFLTTRLTETLTLFENNDIKTVAFKGPAIAELLYDDISLRQFDDIDILIQKKDVIQACKLLAKLGYSSEIKLSKKHEKAFLKNENSINIINKNPHFIIELHWDLLGIYSSHPMTYAYLGKRLKPGMVFGKTVHNLSHEDLLVYLCLHGAKHSWERLEWIYCMAELMHNKYKLNWTTVNHIANEMSCERILGLGIFLAMELFKAPLPDKNIEPILKDPMVETLSEEIINKLFKEEKNFFHKSISRRYSTFHLKVRKKPADRIRYVLKLFFQPSEKEWGKYSFPSYLSALHYLLRPLMLLSSLSNIIYQSIKTHKDPSFSSYK